jgi:hypothetical protein
MILALERGGRVMRAARTSEAEEVEGMGAVNTLSRAKRKVPLMLYWEGASRTTV